MNVESKNGESEKTLNGCTSYVVVTEDQCKVIDAYVLSRARWTGLAGVNDRNVEENTMI